MNAEKTECGSDGPSHKMAECGIENFDSVADNPILYQAVESYEVCSKVVIELCGEIMLGLSATIVARGRKRKLSGQPSLQKRRRRRKETDAAREISSTIAKSVIEEILTEMWREVGKNDRKVDTTVHYGSEERKIRSWLKIEERNRPNNVQGRKELKPRKTKTFKKKNDQPLSGKKLKRGKLGGNVDKMKNFFENWLRQSSVVSELGVEQKANSLKNTASGDWGEGGTAWAKQGVGVITDKRGGGNTSTGQGVGGSGGVKHNLLGLDGD